jgi:two-component system, response regulator YesN
VMDYVGTNFAAVNIRALGGAAEQSPSYLSRLFRSETHMTLKTYVNRVRVEAARRLLLETSEKIESIATLVGFHDASHLSRLFLKYAGRRPGDFRHTWWDDPAEAPRRQLH